MSRRKARVDQNLEKALGSQVAFADHLQEHGSGDLVQYMYRHRALGKLPGLLQWPVLSRYFVWCLGHVSGATLDAVAKLSPSHALFVECWIQLRHNMSQGTMYTSLKPKETPYVKACGRQKLFVKVFPIEDAHDSFTLENEILFSKTSVALALTNLSDGAIPFTHTSAQGDKMICTSLHCGRTVLEVQTHIGEISVMALMALAQLRLYGGLHHFDCHLKNFVVRNTPKRDLVWAFEYETGLDAPVSNTSDMIAGLELANCTCCVTIIDGGLTRPTARGRREIHLFYRREKRVCGWDNLDLDQSNRMLGWTVFRAVTEVDESGEPKMIPILHFDDIPDAAVDPISYLVCLYFKIRRDVYEAKKLGRSAPMAKFKDISLRTLGALTRIVHADPEFGLESVIEFMVYAGKYMGCISYIERARQCTDYVVPLPCPGPEVDEIITSTLDSVFVE